MKIIPSIKSGLYRSLRSWKGVLIIWLVFLILVSLISVPLRSGLISAFGNSMITQKLSDGFNLMTFTDLGSTFKNLVSFVSGGFYFVFLAGFIINAFMTGGLFNSLKQESAGFSTSGFFWAGAKNFWSFLVITLTVSLIIFFLAGLILLIAIIILNATGLYNEKAIKIIATCSAVIFFLLLPVLLLVADYSRAWKALNGDASPFLALGFGFRRTFERFLPSYAIMAGMILIQSGFGLAVIFTLPAWKPQTVGGILLLFILTQLLIYARYLIKSWRFASIISFM